MRMCVGQKQFYTVVYVIITLAGVARMDAGAFNKFIYQMFRYEALEAFVS